MPTGSGPTVRRIAPAFVDARGSIVDILEGETIDSVTLISSRGGAIRGNHYHAETIQYVYVLSGRMRLTTQVPGDEPHSIILERGDLVASRPLERHAMCALADTLFLALSRGPRGGRLYESDTYRLPAAELLERSEG